MNWILLWNLAQRMSIVATAAFLMSRSAFFPRLLESGVNSRREFIVLTGVFGLAGIIGTYAAIPVGDALANSRVIGPAVAGLIGGPWMGLGAGLLAGIHRAGLGGFTSLACAVATPLEGLLAGLAQRVLKEKTYQWSVAFGIGFLVEAAQMGIILLIARPFSAAWSLVSLIGLPMMIVNAFGIAVFVSIVHLVRLQREQVGALQAQKALAIANQTLPYFRKGLTKTSASHAAQLILSTTGVAAVAITDCGEVLAHVGAGEDHHHTGSIQTEATRFALARDQIVIAQNQQEIGCSRPDCPLHSSVIAPLHKRGEVIGALKLYQTSGKQIGSVEQELAKGLASLFSYQLELADLAFEQRLRSKAEIRALQAQINPHFLFNALNTIRSYVRTDPDKARDLLIHLADFFRTNLADGREFVELSTELSHVHSYLAIEHARFGDRLIFTEQIDPSTRTCLVPPLTLQPLVENALRHGLLPKADGGELKIRSYHDGGDVVLEVSDNGMGMQPDLIRTIQQGQLVPTATGGIGLSNVVKRLQAIYGQNHQFTISSAIDEGTTILIRIPCSPISGGIDHDLANSGSR